MLWFVGLDLGDLYRDGLIRDVQPVASAENWDAVLPAEISKRLKVDGKYVAVPADLHCGNWTFANNKLLRAADLEVPQSWAAVIKASDKLQQAGVIPIAFGGQPWQEGSVFVMVLTGVGGASLLRRFVADHDLAAADGPEMVETFATFARLKPFVDKASPNRSWSDTANLVSTNQAALYFSGDWARGDLNQAGMRPEIDYSCGPAPGNAGIFMAVVDAFCMPSTKDPDTLAAQDAFAARNDEHRRPARFQPGEGQHPAPHRRAAHRLRCLRPDGRQAWPRRRPAAAVDEHGDDHRDAAGDVRRGAPVLEHRRRGSEGRGARPQGRHRADAQLDRCHMKRALAPIVALLPGGLILVGRLLRLHPVDRRHLADRDPAAAALRFRRPAELLAAVRGSAVLAIVPQSGRVRHPVHRRHLRSPACCSPSPCTGWDRGPRPVLRMVFLYPLSVSWLVTGLVWQWVLNPGLGLERAVQALGWSGFRFDALVREQTAIYTVVGAGAWHMCGLVMALFLAGLRGIDPDIWQATRIEGIPAWRAYWHVILPMLRPYALTVVLLLSFAVARMFDLVVAMTGGGPGFATDMPALLIYDHDVPPQPGRRRRSRGASCSMLTMLAVLAPYVAIELRRNRA